MSTWGLTACTALGAGVRADSGAEVRGALGAGRLCRARFGGPRLGMGVSLVRVGGPTSGMVMVGMGGTEEGIRLVCSRGCVGSWAIEMVVRGGMDIMEVMGGIDIMVVMGGMLVIVVMVDMGTEVGCVGSIMGVRLGGPFRGIIWGGMDGAVGAMEVCIMGGMELWSMGAMEVCSMGAIEVWSMGAIEVCNMGAIVV